MQEQQLIIERIKNYKKDLIRFRYENPAYAKEIVKKIRKTCRQEKISQEISKRALVYADVYYSELLVNEGNITSAINLGIKTQRVALKYQYNDLYSIQCNLLAYAYKCLDDYENTLFWLHKAYEIAVFTNILTNVCSTSFNIGEIYLELGDYEQALNYYNSAKEYINACTGDRSLIPYIDEQYDLHMAKYYVKTKSYDKALLLAEKLARKKNFHTEALLILIEIFSATNAIEHCIKSINDVFPAIEQLENVLEKYEMLHTIFVAALCINQIKICDKCLCLMHECVEKIQIPGKWVSYYDAVIQYSQAFHQPDNLDEVYRKYYEWSEINQEKITEGILVSLNNQVQLYQLHKKQDRLERKKQKFEEQQYRDSLTGVYNRFGMQHRFADYLEYAKQTQSPLGVCLLDIDHFKQYNDSYGHRNGDRCLSKVAQILKKHFKDQIVCRFGGDEFFILARNLTEDEFKERLFATYQDKQLQKIRDVNEPTTHAITLSMGAIYAIPPDDLTDRAFLNEVDRLLYMGKKQKRNCIHFRNHFVHY